MKRIRRLIAVTTLSVVVAFSAGAPAAAPAATAPHILEFEYSEDYEGIGRHHNAYATLRGDADRVTARVGSLRSEGRFDDVAGPRGYWNFRERAFVRALLDDLRTDGEASVKVKAVGASRTVRKVCELKFEPDERFGDYAGGDCRPV